VLEIIQTIFLGILQGITEFLPVSSSGHLILFQRIFGMENPGMTLEVVLHLGTLVSVFIVFWKDIWALIKKPFQKTTWLLIAATIPAVIAALVFDVEALFDADGPLSLIALGIAFLATGIILMITSKLPNGKKDMERMSYLDGLIIGVAQAVAIIPGLSRSGTTIATGLFRGMTREGAARFSFLLSIPAILGATILDFRTAVASLEGFGMDFWPLLLGFVAATITGYFAIRFMLKIIREAKLKYFSYYLFGLAIVVFVYAFI